VIEDAAVERWFFLDQTLMQLFDHYGVRRSIGKKVAQQALALEKRGYERARGIIMHSNWAKLSVVKDYGIPEEKVRVVVPGANIEPDLYRQWTKDAGPREHDPRRPLRLVFVGKDWKRKGLDRLLQALSLASQQGFRGTLRVIGCRADSVPRSMRNVARVEWVGFVDRERDARRFLDLVSSCDLGCLLSLAEAGGISQREFHALGLAVLGTDAGGAPEHRVPGASFEVPARATPREIARMLCEIEQDVERRTVAWQNAAAARESALWSATVAQIQEIMHTTAPR
jgi:glycosyltransferase involved in cell wall biosynthesis